MFVELLVALLVSFSVLCVATVFICVIAGTRESPERQRMEDEIQAKVLAAYQKCLYNF